MFRWWVGVGLCVFLSACAVSAPPVAQLGRAASVTAPLPAITAAAATALPSATAGPTASPSPTPSHTPAPLPSPTASPTPEVPRADHVVVVVFENRSFGEIVGSACCPFINQQIQASAFMTQSFAVTHPSQPNYLDLFSGSNQGVTSDVCPPPGAPFGAPNLGQQLLNAGLSFTGFAEDLPDGGAATCNTDTYAVKHVPWAFFSNVPASASRGLSTFPTDFDQLPTVSLVIPNLCNDMHNCGSNTGDNWLSQNLAAYIKWAQTHNSLLIFTFDEDDTSASNRIITFFEGQIVKPGRYGQHITHYNVLRTLEAMYGLPYAGQAAHVATIVGIWD
jgi:phospholipase C